MAYYGTGFAGIADWLLERLSPEFRDLWGGHVLLLVRLLSYETFDCTGSAARLL